jgi:beta-alanine--pyruvate transaminase
VTPDLITMAKAINNAAVPMGAVAVRREVHDAVINATAARRHRTAARLHLFGPSAGDGGLYRHAGPLQARQAVRTRAEMSPKFESAVHALRGAPYVKDVRNLGLVAGVELESRPGAPGARAYEAFLKCLELGVLVRYTGDILAFSPPLIISRPRSTSCSTP